MTRQNIGHNILHCAIPSLFYRYKAWFKIHLNELPLEALFRRDDLPWVSRPPPSISNLVDHISIFHIFYIILLGEKQDHLRTNVAPVVKQSS